MGQAAFSRIWNAELNRPESRVMEAATGKRKKRPIPRSEARVLFPRGRRLRLPCRWLRSA